MKEKNFKEKETERTRGKKKFIVRKHEEKEREQEIKEFINVKEEHPDNDDIEYHGE